MSVNLNHQRLHSRMYKKIALLTFIFCAASIFLQGQTLLEKKVRLESVTGSVSDILNEISNIGGFVFTYSNQIDIRKPVVIESGTETVRTWLDKIFGPGSLDYIANQHKIILRPKSARDHRVTICGHVTDSLTGEVLIGATILVKALSIGTSSNPYGFFSITIPEGAHRINVSFMGYRTVSHDINSTEDHVLNFQLAPSSYQLDEISIVAYDEETKVNINAPEIGVHQLSAAAIGKIPALAGEVDVLRALQLLPGVKNSGEASASISVRGGNLDQNMILLDEAPVYNPSHAIGVFSVFNTDAVKDIQLYKGSIPAEYGGRLSSIVDIKMKDGNSKKTVATGGIGSISSRLTVEGPVKRDRSSFLLSGRYTYSDAITQAVKFMRQNNFRFYFYDFNFKASHVFNSRNKLFLSSYAGQDVNKLGILSDVTWNNTTGTVRWNHIFNENLFSNTTLLYSEYNYNIRAGYINPFSWNSRISDFTLRNDFTFFSSHSNTFKFGFSSTHHEINPGSASVRSNADISLPVFKALEHTVYLSNEQHLTKRLLAQYGLRYSLFQNMGKSTVYSYNSSHEITDTVHHNSTGVYHTNGGLEPRVALRYSLNDRTSLKAGYSRTCQYLQLLSNSSFGLSAFDTWYPSGVNLKPQKADQVSIGYFKNLQHDLEASVEVYHKWLYNQIEFVDHARLLFNPDLEGELRIGKGYAYGAEFLLKKNTGRLTGWLSYTYARTKKLIPEISTKAFNANYDQPHNITAVANYNLTTRVSLSGNWVYATGRPTTLPIESYGYKDYHVSVYAERNSIRLPHYHRLDLSLTIQSKERPARRFTHNWVFSVYNVYARRNPLMIFTSRPFADFKSSRGIDAYTISILPFIPSVTYNFKF